MATKKQCLKRIGVIVVLSRPNPVTATSYSLMQFELITQKKETQTMCENL